MKYKIECDSPLLQYTLECFLKDYLDENGKIITDNHEKEGILIGKDIFKPFTKNSLILQLENMAPEIEETKSELLEDKINTVFDKFKQELIQILKEHYAEE